MRPAWVAAAFVAGLVSVGCSAEDQDLLPRPGGGGAGAGGGAGDGGVAPADGGIRADAMPSAPPPSIDGMWMLFGFEDPFTVDLELTPRADVPGYLVGGSGCFDGPTGLLEPKCPPALADSCGPVVGNGTGVALAFGVAFRSVRAVYAADVYVSQDGQRMAGTFSSGPPDGVSPFGRGLGWAKLDGQIASCGQLTFPPADVGPIDWGRSGGATKRLVLQGNTAVGWLEPGRTYSMNPWGSSFATVTGDLGAFWNPDFHWDEGTRTLSAGPVPATVPGMPVALQIRFDEHLAIREVVATSADGATGTLLPAPPL